MLCKRGGAGVGRTVNSISFPVYNSLLRLWLRGLIRTNYRCASLCLPDMNWFGFFKTYTRLHFALLVWFIAARPPEFRGAFQVFHSAQPKRTGMNTTAQPSSTIQPPFNQFSGTRKTAIITGASSGIGLERPKSFWHGDIASSQTPATSALREC